MIKIIFSIIGLSEHKIMSSSSLITSPYQILLYDEIKGPIIVLVST